MRSRSGPGVSPVTVSQEMPCSRMASATSRKRFDWMAIRPHASLVFLARYPGIEAGMAEFGKILAALKKAGAS